MKRYKQFGEYFERLMRENEPYSTQKKVAEKLGIEQGTLSKIKGGTLIPSDELAERIACIWNDSNFMEEVYKARRKDAVSLFRKPKSNRDEECQCVLETKPRLPVTASAGVLSDYIGGVLEHECEWLPVMRSLPDYDFTMIVKGNSMEPKFEGGDEIALKKVENVIEWGNTYVLDTKDGAVLKRLYKYENGVRCVSYNKEYPDFVVNECDINGVYRVVGLIRI